jgi:hypothetical protein
MPDRIHVIITTPTDDSLPIDVQLVGLRRKAIEAMQEVADISEQSVRYRGGTEDATVLDPDGHTISLWQQNLRAGRFVADGDVHDGVLVPVTRYDEVSRVRTGTAFTRNEFD